MREEFNFLDLDPKKDRLFFDYDGTVREFVPSSEASKAFATKGTQETFQKLIKAGFEIALISGRSIEEPAIGEPCGSLDTFMAPLKLAASGLHGFQWRRSYGAEIEVPANVSKIDQYVLENARVLKEQYSTLQVEVKSPYHLTIHFREVEAGRQQGVQDIIEDKFSSFLSKHSEYKLQYGEKVIELCPDQIDGIKIDKGMALDRFMRQANDQKRPVFFGDDAAIIENGKLKIGTDESAMIAAQDHHGIAVLVGAQAQNPNSVSAADYSVSSPTRLLEGLKLLADSLSQNKFVPRIEGLRPVLKTGQPEIV